MKTLEQELSRVDLNLLVSLSVLLKEKSVSRATDKLFLSQPAMSRVLGRLRDLFDDPLFYRESNGLQPTTKALELVEQLDGILFNIDSLLNSTVFSPDLCEKTFRISTPPLMSKLIIPSITKAVYEVAPKVTIEEYPSSIEPTLLLKDNQVDFSIHVKGTTAADDEYSSEVIGSTHPVIYGSVNHPLLKKKNVSIDDCLEYSFVDLAPDIRSIGDYRNPIDIQLLTQGKQRTIAVKSGQILTLIEVIKDTSGLIIAGHLLEKDILLSPHIKAILSFDTALYKTDIHLIEHRRTSTSPAHSWMRSLIMKTLQHKFHTPD